MKKITAFLLIILITFSVYSAPKKKEIFDPKSVKLFTISSVNTTHSDFGPALIGDSLYFTSYRDEALSKSEKDIKKKEFYNLFNLQIDKEGNIKGGRHLINDFDTRYHDGPVAWCQATGELFITQSNYLEPGPEFKPLRTNNFNLRILIAKRINGAWKMTGSLPFNSPKYSVGHPAISTAGDTLIFSSNKPGGLGETDLYLSIRKNGQWGEPINLGDKINSSGKDEFPFLSKDGFLVYASSGRQGMGGLDLYYTKLNDLEQEIVHFESPINSSNDDFSMIIPPDVEYGYLTSDRMGGLGSDDVYKITFERLKEYFMELLVIDAKSRRVIPGADIAFDDNMKFKTEQTGLASRKILPEMSYTVNVKAFGYTDGTKNIKTGLLKPGILLRDTILMDMIVKKSIVLNHIYYDFDKWDILPESGEELNKLVAFMVENPEIKAQLSSHTDSRGTTKYNQKLSDRRAQSAVDYMIAQGIDKDRLTAQGYGETVPVNKCIDKVTCSPSELRMNRRTEFSIPEFGKSKDVDQSGKGDFTTSPDSKTKSKETSSVKKPSQHSVIVGSFSDLPNAEKFIEQLKVIGYKAEIISDAKPFKVGIGFKDIKSAQEELTKLKVKYPNAWIL